MNADAQPTRRLLVVGDRGKSTFINSIFGSAVVPYCDRTNALVASGVAAVTADGGLAAVGEELYKASFALERPGKPSQRGQVGPTTRHDFNASMRRATAAQRPDVARLRVTGDMSRVEPRTPDAEMLLADYEPVDVVECSGHAVEATLSAAVCDARSTWSHSAAVVVMSADEAAGRAELPPLARDVLRSMDPERVFIVVNLRGSAGASDRAKVLAAGVHHVDSSRVSMYDCRAALAAAVLGHEHDAVAAALRQQIASALARDGATPAPPPRSLPRYRIEGGPRPLAGPSVSSSDEDYVPRCMQAEHRAVAVETIARAKAVHQREGDGCVPAENGRTYVPAAMAQGKIASELLEEQRAFVPRVA